MQYEVLHTIKGDKVLKPGDVVGEGAVLSKAQIDDLVQAGFLTPFAQHVPESYVDRKLGMVAVDEVPVDEGPEESLEDMNLRLSEIDPELVCDTVEEARALLARHAEKN